MTVTQHLVGLVAVAVATITILTVGTLVAADVIRLPARRRRRG
jgi:hypothetical protein